MRAVCGTARLLGRFEPSGSEGGSSLSAPLPDRSGNGAAPFSGLHRVRITVALMMVAGRRLCLLDVTGLG
jgi:hypothetical protein